MAFKADWPDARYGFWVALGVIAALAIVALLRTTLGKVTKGH